jgi:hypothetical protein
MGDDMLIHQGSRGRGCNGTEEGLFLFFHASDRVLARKEKRVTS